MKDNHDIDILGISNQIFNSKHDTLVIYSQRYYLDNRNKYFKYDLKVGEIFDKDGNSLMRILPTFEQGIDILQNSMFIYYDSLNNNKYTQIVVDSNITFITNKEEKDKHINENCTDQYLNYSTSLFNDSTKGFVLSSNTDYCFVYKLQNHQKSYIVYKHQITDSIKSFEYLDNNMKSYFYPLSPENINVSNDTLFCVIVSKSNLSDDLLTLSYFDIFSIYQGKKSLLSDSISMKEYLKKSKWSYPFCVMDDRRYFYAKATVIILAKIDNTFILFDTYSRKYLFYDYINKNFFDPVIKIIDD